MCCVSACGDACACVMLRTQRATVLEKEKINDVWAYALHSALGPLSAREVREMCGACSPPGSAPGMAENRIPRFLGTWFPRTYLVLLFFCLHAWLVVSVCTLFHL